MARIVQNSRGVYDSIQEKRKAVVLSPDEAATLDGKMDRLRARLKFLGEQVLTGQATVFGRRYECRNPD